MSEPKRYEYKCHEESDDCFGVYEDPDGYYVTYSDWQAEHAARLVAEKVKADYDRWLSNGVHFTTDEYTHPVEEIRVLRAERDTLRAQLAAERERAAKLADALKYASICLGPGGSDPIDEALADYQAQG